MKKSILFLLVAVIIITLGNVNILAEGSANDKAEQLEELYWIYV